jgi:POT family proton-dependent oligopeptide transporter
VNIVFLLGILIIGLTMVPVVRQLRDHPRGLVILFFAELWERFSYYGMRGLLLFYLTQHFLFQDKDANSRYAAYTTLVALLPLTGAIIADRILGTRKAVAFGALLLVAGHLTMALEGAPAQNMLAWHGQTYAFETHGQASTRVVKIDVAGKAYAFATPADGSFDIKDLPAGAPLPAHLAKGDYEITVRPVDALHTNLLFVALSLIVLGVAFLKTTPLVAQLYGREDPRRDAGFTLFYYGVNLGAFAAGLICGWLGENIGWWAGFGLAAVGMSAGYIVFILGKPLLEGHGEPPDPVKLAKPLIGPINREWTIYICAVLGVGVVNLLMRQSVIIGSLLIVVTASAGLYLGVYMVRSCTPVERRRIGLALILTLGSVVFWTLFQQAGTSLSLFADRNTALDLVGKPISIPAFGHTLFIGTREMLEAAHLAPGQAWWVDAGLTAPQTQSLNPGFILIFATFFSWLWAYLGQRGRNPPVMVKFGIALLQIGLGFLLLVWGAQFADASFRVPLYFLVGAYLLHTTGELCLSPVGLSVVSRLSPPALVATLLSVWSLSGAWAQFVGGKIAAMAATQTIGGKVTDPHASLLAAVQVFTWIGIAGIICGVVFLALGPLIRAWGEAPDDDPPAILPDAIPLQTELT